MGKSRNENSEEAFKFYKVLETIPPQNRTSQMNLGNGECESSAVKTLRYYRMLLQMCLPSSHSIIVEKFTLTKRMFFKGIATL